MNYHKLTHTIPSLLCAFILSALLAACAAPPPAPPQDINLLPKYGLVPKNAEQRAADDQFIAKMGQEYRGDFKKASQEIAERGWYLLRQGDSKTAMERFNQAWLLDPENASALWGMAELQGQANKFKEALGLFNEAELLLDDNMDFMADYAKTMGFAGLRQKDDSLVRNALFRFSNIYDRAPEHTQNLQNWAVVLYFLGDYRTAWEKINLAMATPGRDQLNPVFIDKLQSKMPRP